MGGLNKLKKQDSKTEDVKEKQTEDAKKNIVKQLLKKKKFIPAPVGFCEIEIDKILKAGWNYKSDNDSLKEKLKANIKLNGQVENIVVRQLEEDVFECCNGNHRLDVLLELKYKKVYCFNLGAINKKQAMRVAIETNETKFSTDNVRLAGVFQEIFSEMDITDLVNTMPFSVDEMKGFKDLLDFDWDEYNKTSGEEIESDKKTKTSETELGIVNLTVPLTSEQYQKWVEWQQIYYANLDGFDGDSGAVLVRALEIAISNFG